MMKTIWIVNYYAAIPGNVLNPRYIEFARRFEQAGYKVLTFNSSRSSDTDDEQKAARLSFIQRSYDGLDYVHVKVPEFKGNGVRRMYSIFAFAFRLYKARSKFSRPDIVLHNVHTPFDYPVMWAARRLKAKYVAEAWDMWPEDFVTFGIVGANNPAMKIFYHLEKKLYTKADQIVFTMEGGADYIRKKGWSTETGGPVDLGKVHYINNGVNLTQFDADCVAYAREEDEDLNAPDTIKIVYIGAIRLVNHVKDLIDAAALLQNDHRYRFIIYGNGTDREMLERYVVDNQIGNVIFKEKRIPFCEVPYVVSKATVNIMNYQKDFGIHGVSSGKMFLYMAAGKPICCNIALNYSDISRNHLGIDENLDTPQQYAAAIRRLAEQPEEEYKEMCERVRECAALFDYGILASKEIQVLES